MSDLIDRQTAIETAIEAADKWDGGYSSEREGIIRKFFDKVPAAQSDHIADTGKKVERTDETAQNVSDSDLVSRKAAIEAIEKAKMAQTPDGEIYVAKYNAEMNIQLLPTAQPDKDVIDDCLRHIYKNISVHTATGGVIAIRYYMEKLYEEIYGEGERPWWMK